MDRLPFSALLLAHRRAARLTQDELALRAGLGVRTVRDLESGRAQRPQRSTVELLAAALGLHGHALAGFHAAARGRPVPRRGVPAIGPLIGRDVDIAGLSALLETAGLVTVVGLGGVGKAVLAATVARGMLDRFTGGVGAIRVTEASTEPELLASAVGALGAANLDELALRGTDGRALLVVAGADRSPATARAAVGWLRERTQATILVTSRHPLGLPGEYQWALGPLEVPPETVTGVAAFDYPATQLFLERLRLVRSAPVTAAEAPTVASLVRRLGGLPLALELAAARGRVLELAQMLARTGAADPAEGAVRASVLASWELLDELERHCLCALSVFQWRWSLELAEQLLAGLPRADRQSRDVVSVVDRLVGLGLVRVRSGNPDPPVLRMSVFGAVRQVALEEAERLGILAAARDRHAAVLAAVCAGVTDAGATVDDATITAYLSADVRAAADLLLANGEGGSAAYRALVPWLS